MSKQIKQCYRKKYDVPIGEKMWEPCELPQGVSDCIEFGETYSGRLFWGYWNTHCDFRTNYKTAADKLKEDGFWPDWVIITEDGIRHRVRYISGTTENCPSGPCGRKSGFILFSQEEANVAKLDKIWSINS